MLSNVSIKKLLKSKDLIIDPWYDDMMDAARITLHLGKKILVPQSGGVIDIKKETTPRYREIRLTDQKPLRLKPNMFVLGETFEHIGLSEKVGMLLDGRSTLARLGLMVTQTAMIVDTGQAPKTMTLEIKNNGPQTILLYPQMKFCRAAIFLLNPPATMRYDSGGKYLTGDPHKPIFRKETK